MEGWMEKRGGMLGRQWQTRYFLIDGSMLRWFMCNRKEECKGALSLSKTQVKADGAHGFTIGATKLGHSNTAKTYVFQCSNKNERDAWVVALSAVSDMELVVVPEDMRPTTASGIGTLESALTGSSAAVLFNKGVIAHALGDLEAAHEHWTGAIVADSAMAEAYYNRATVRLTLGDEAGAMADFDTALQNNSGLVHALVNRSHLKQMQDDSAGARQDAETAVEVQPRNPQLLTHRAYLKWTDGEFDGALEDLNKAVELGSTEASTFFQRAVARAQKQNDVGGAIEDLKRCIEQGPQFTDAYSLRALLLLTHRLKEPGTIETAQGDIEVALTANPRDVVALNCRSIISRVHTKDMQAAKADLQAALVIEPHNPATLKHLTELTNGEDQ